MHVRIAFAVLLVSLANGAVDAGTRFADPNRWVRSYGVKCDGVTDDVRAVQRALNENPGQRLLFPAGVCAFGSGLRITRSGTAIEGQGSETTTLLFTQAPEPDSADIVFTAPDPEAGLDKSSISGAIRRLSISNGTHAPTAGIGLQLVQAKRLHIEDVSVHNAFIGVDFVGGNDVHVTDSRTVSGGGWTHAQAGSRCLRFRAQPLAAGGSWPASNVYVVNSECYGANKYAEVGIEISGADTLLFDNMYICCTARDAVLMRVTGREPGAYVANIVFNGGMIDGNPGGEFGVRIASDPQALKAKYSDIALNGIVVSNFEHSGVVLEANNIFRFSATGAHFANNHSSSFDIEAMRSATLTGNSFVGGGWSIHLNNAKAVGDSLAIVGNSWDNSFAKANEGHAVVQSGNGQVSGRISIVGNVFGAYREPVAWMGTPPEDYKPVGNSGLASEPDVVGPLKLMGPLTLPVRTVDHDTQLTRVDSVVLLKGDKAFMTTLPPAAESKGVTYTLKNLSTTPQSIVRYISLGGRAVSAVAVGVSLRLISDGESWQEY